MKKNIILLFFSLFLILASLEIFIKIFYPQNLSGWYAVRDESGLNILRNNSTYYHRVFDRKIKYNFGNLNNRTTIETNEKDRILFLGDSFTFGWLVNDKDTFIHLIQDYLNNYQIINSSVPGWGTADYTRFTENYCENIKPKKIIVVLNTDDFRRGYISKLYKMDISNVIKKNTDTNNIFNSSYFEIMNKFNVTLGKEKQLVTSSKFHKIPFYKFLIKNSHLFYLIRETVVNIKNGKFLNTKTELKDEFIIPNVSIPEEYEVANIFGKILFVRLNELAKKCKSELNVIYTGWYDYKNLPFLHNPTIYFLSEAKNFFKNQNIKYFDLTDRMKIMHINPRKYIIKYDGHPNELGHKIIAENIIHLFKTNQIN